MNVKRWFETGDCYVPICSFRHHEIMTTLGRQWGKAGVRARGRRGCDGRNQKNGAGKTVFGTRKCWYNG